MEEVIKSYLEFLQGIAWPLIVLFALIWFRQPIVNLITRISLRTRKLAFGNVSLELAPLVSFSPDWKIGERDARNLTSSSAFDSYSESLFKQISEKTSADFVIIDLGSGREWLASRLFIFSIMLARMRNIRHFVFVETEGSVFNRFIGIGNPEEIRWSLAVQYPWFEAAFAKAYLNIMGVEVPGIPPYTDVTEQDSFIMDKHGALEWGIARSVVNQFIGSLQHNVPPIPEQSEDWIEIPPNKDYPSSVWEKTIWLTGGDLRMLLPGLDRESYVKKTPEKTREDVNNEILRCKGDIVAIVSEDREFRALVDRHSLLE